MNPLINVAVNQRPYLQLSHPCAGGDPLTLFSRAGKHYGATRRRCGFAVVILLLTVLVLSWQSSASWAQTDFSTSSAYVMERSRDEVQRPAVQHDFACSTTSSPFLNREIWPIYDGVAVPVLPD